jgi:hypothetical protein
MTQSVENTPESADQQATRFVIERNQLRDRAALLAAAWEVWSEAQHGLRRIVRTAEWSGDLGGQRAELARQYGASVCEAYARARVQCAIALLADGLDQVADYDRHWAETWGPALAGRAADAYAQAFDTARARQQEAHAAAAVVTDAWNTAGITVDLDPRPVAPAPEPPRHGFLTRLLARFGSPYSR